jgi:hypothetical protein
MKKNWEFLWLEVQKTNMKTKKISLNEDFIFTIISIAIGFLFGAQSLYEVFFQAQLI